ncbi:MAG: hypothetical protein M1309_02175 [Actinobacteria bacterium]|nr:hypothetical protein [Actinomycetota bacterium]
MSNLVSKAGLAIVIGAAATIIYAQKRAAETGKDMMTVLSNLPDELKKTQADLKIRIEKAVNAGKQAADRKEKEIDQQLEEKPPEPANIDYVV